MPVRFSHVDDDIYRGGKPSVSDLQILSDVFGVKRIITLDGKIGAEIAPLVKSLGMEHIVIPIGGLESKPLINFLKDSISVLLQNQPVYVHCRHGSDRTGMAIAIYRIQNGWSTQDAIKEARSFDFGEKLTPDTEKFYSNAILSESKNEEDINDFRETSAHDSFESAYDDLFFTYNNPAANIIGDDIVSNMRDWFNFGDVPPAFNPQQSFAPKDDVKFNPPDPALNNAPPEFRDPYYFMSAHKYPSSKRRKKIRRILMEELSPKGVPISGLYDNFQGTRGHGLMTGTGESGGFAHSERGAIPGGVAPSTTGGPYLNL